MVGHARFLWPARHRSFSGPGPPGQTPKGPNAQAPALAAAGPAGRRAPVRAVGAAVVCLGFWARGDPPAARTGRVKAAGHPSATGVEPTRLTGASRGTLPCRRADGACTAAARGRRVHSLDVARIAQVDLAGTAG